MQTKGSSLIILRKYVKRTFGDDSYKRWLNTLSAKANTIHSGTILPNAWYSLEFGSNEPLEKICNLFYEGDCSKSWLIGRYVAEKGLKGIFRFFVKIGNPNYMLTKGSTIMSSYFSSGNVEITSKNNNHVVIRILDFPEMTKIMEFHIGGWLERALEISGCKNVKVTVTKSLIKHDPHTEYNCSWD